MAIATGLEKVRGGGWGGGLIRLGGALSMEPYFYIPDGKVIFWQSVLVRKGEKKREKMDFC